MFYLRLVVTRLNWQPLFRKGARTPILSGGNLVYINLANGFTVLVQKK